MFTYTSHISGYPTFVNNLSPKHVSFEIVVTICSLPLFQHAPMNSSGRTARLTVTALRTTRAVRLTDFVRPVDVTLSMEDPDVKSVSEMLSS